MITLEQGVRIALPLVQTKAKHRHYDHVVNLSEKYYRPMITGENVGHLIHQFNKRENAEEYKQRLRLTQVITPSITNTIMTPVRKVPKVKPVVDSCTFGPDKKDADDKLRKALDGFWNGKGVDHFFSAVLLDQSSIDPNAFCLVLYDGVEQRTEAPVVYPSIISAADAWHFEYFNGELQWLWVHRAIQYEEKEAKHTGKRKQERITGKTEDKPKMKDGHAFWLYTDQNHIMFRQVDPATISAQDQGVIIESSGTEVQNLASVAMQARDIYYYRVSPKELYEVSFYEQSLGMVQAFRIGYVPDQRTNGQTMVNIWHPALPYLLKGIKAGSELDLSAALHAFLQKIAYANPCQGYKDEAGHEIMCNGGTTPDGGTCKKCGGSGYTVHSSGQDHVTLRMPRNKEDFLDLAQMVHYVPLPVEVLEWQDKYVDKLEDKCYRAVYNSDRFRADSANVTATGEIIDLQSVYDTLKPVADWYSQSRVLIYRLVASFTAGEKAANDLKVAHAFPRNMRYETLNERVQLMRALREAGASSASLLQVDATIIEDLYIDDPVAEKQAKTRASFDPFIGKTEAAILTLISQDLATKEQKVFWTNMSLIFSRAEQQAMEGNTDFYELERTKQQDILDEITADLMDQISGDAEAATLKLPTGTADPNNPDAGGDGGNPDASGDGGNPTDPATPPSPGNSATS